MSVASSLNRKPVLAYERVRRCVAKLVREAEDGSKEHPVPAAIRDDPANVMKLTGMEPDPAQIELMQCRDKDVLVLWTRQFAGKSQTAACIALCNAMTNLGRDGQGSTTLVFSAGQRESTELLRKVKHLRYGLLNRHLPLTRGVWRPKSVAKDIKLYRGFMGLDDAEDMPAELEAVTDAKTMLELENGSRIISLPAKAQATIGWTVDLLILDEAKVIPDDLYHSVRSTLALTKGRMLAFTTPLGQRGWFWNEWKKCDEAKLSGKMEPYRRFRRTCWECPRLDREFVEKERQLIGEHWFRQEYECAFLDPIGAVFRGEDIDRTLQSKEKPYAVPW